MLPLSRFTKVLFLAGLSLILLACGDSTTTLAPASNPTLAAPVPTTASTTTAASTTAAITTSVATTSVPTTLATTIVPTTVRATNTPSPDDPEAKARKAVQDEAQRSQKIDPADLQFVSIEQQDWADSSLGCPKPGELYSQIVTPGYRIVVLLKSQNVRYEYHTNLNGKAILCKP